MPSRPRACSPNKKSQPSWKIILTLALFSVLTCACAQTIPAPETPQPIPTASVTPDPGPCGYQWASQSLPELSDQLLASLKKTGLPVTAARAEAYGENCLYSDGSLASFSAMETDYHITLAPAALDNPASLGALLEQTLSVIDEFPVSQTPGPNPGYIGITFQAGDQVQNLWFERRKAEELRSQGLSGEKLFQALNPGN